MDSINTINTEEEQYSALKTISVIIKTIAVIVGLVGVISAFATLFSELPIITQVGAFIGIAIATFINVILMWAGAELINLLIAIEHNTYETRVELMSKRSIKAA